jgi:hypothetical protein
LLPTSLPWNVMPSPLIIASAYFRLMTFGT